MSWKKEDLAIVIQQQRQINRLDKLLEQKNGGGKKDSGRPDPGDGKGCAIFIVGILILCRKNLAHSIGSSQNN